MDALHKDFTDEQLAQNVQKGDTEAFGILVDRFQDKMLRYARKFLLFDSAEDAAQDVFLKAYENIQSFDIKQRFSPWLYRIAHNHYINLIKKKGTEEVPFFDADVLFPHPVAKERAETEMQKADSKQEVEKYLQTLKVKYREVAVLYYLEELSYGEISDVLKIPTSTVGIRLKRAKEALRKMARKEKI